MTIPCNKERELGMMAEKLDNIQKSSDKNSKKIDAILAKIDLLPGMFVLRKEFNEFKKASLEKEKNFKQKMWELFKIALPYIIIGLLFLFRNSFGI
jgi:uncharacterized membrane protein YraQ (UPF0718 family)